MKIVALVSVLLVVALGGCVEQPYPVYVQAPQYVQQAPVVVQQRPVIQAPFCQNVRIPQANGTQIGAVACQQADGSWRVQQ